MSWPDSNSDGLDELLQKARWPEPAAEQLERLNARWRRTVVRRKVRIGASLVAIGLIPIAGVLAAISLLQPKDAVLPQMVQQQPKLESTNDLQPAAVVQEVAVPATDDVNAVAEENRALAWSMARVPTVYEQTWLLVHGGRNVAQQADAISEPPAGSATATTTVEATAELKVEPKVDELFAAMSNSRVSVRLDAAKTLGGLNDPTVSERLVQMAVRNVNRREALVGLVCSMDPVAREFLDFAARDVELAATVRALSLRFAVQ